jgi:hypothetical protein
MIAPLNFYLSGYGAIGGKAYYWNQLEAIFSALLWDTCFFFFNGFNSVSCPS